MDRPVAMRVTATSSALCAALGGCVSKSTYDGVVGDARNAQAQLAAEARALLFQQFVQKFKSMTDAKPRRARGSA